jgi:hypothetical protein
MYKTRFSRYAAVADDDVISSFPPALLLRQPTGCGGGVFLSLSRTRAESFAIGAKENSANIHTGCVGERN